LDPEVQLDGSGQSNMDSVETQALPVAPSRSRSLSSLSHEESEASIVARAEAELPRAMRGDTSGGELLKRTFGAFCGSSGGMDRRGFAELCRQCFLTDKRFTLADMEHAFSQVSANQLCINLKQFDAALCLIAERKAMKEETVRWAVMLFSLSRDSAGAPTRMTRQTTRSNFRARVESQSRLVTRPTVAKAMPDVETGVDPASEIEVTMGTAGTTLEAEVARPTVGEAVMVAPAGVEPVVVELDKIEPSLDIEAAKPADARVVVEPISVEQTEACAAQVESAAPAPFPLEAQAKRVAPVPLELEADAEGAATTLPSEVQSKNVARIAATDDAIQRAVDEASRVVEGRKRRSTSSPSNGGAIPRRSASAGAEEKKRRALDALLFREIVRLGVEPKDDMFPRLLGAAPPVGAFCQGVVC